MKKIIFIFLICLLLSGCSSSQVYEDNDYMKSSNEEISETKTIDISLKEYINLINSVFIESTETNKYLCYDGYSTNYPYIQISIKPKKKISKSELEKQSKIVEEKVLENLKKYRYKSGGFFKYDYEFINIYFYDYADNGKLSRNEGPFIQLNILEI